MSNNTDKTKDASSGKGSTTALCSPRDIGKIRNYYGGLSVKAEHGKYYWNIEDYAGDDWEEIPLNLFNALNDFQDSLT